MPKRMPSRLERELRDMPGWRKRPNPVDSLQVRDALLDSPQSGGEALPSGLPALRQGV
jgi:hypothetical protein